MIRILSCSFALITLHTFSFVGIVVGSPVDSTVASPILSWNSHFQWTTIIQEHLPFSATYSGQHSLDTSFERKLSVTSTLYFGSKLWKNGEGYLDLELGGGSGVSSTEGIAGFPNGEVYRVGDPSPVLAIARIFIQHTIPLSTSFEPVEEGADALGGEKPSTRLVLTAGRFSLADFFDFNEYSHDPRTQFFNWSIWAMGAWDYAADTRGYTWGAVTELIDSTYEARIAAVMVPSDANGPFFDHAIDKAFSLNAEFVKPYHLFGNDAKIHLIAFLNKANMGNYAQAIAEAHGAPPDVISTRSYNNVKYGGGISIEQPLSDAFGFFARLSWNDGRNETWAFTEIDNSIVVGLHLDGMLWHRPEDNVGIAGAINGLSSDHRAYLAAGGYGFLIGDGALNYAPETIGEAYYGLHITNAVTVTGDYQIVFNPAYNRDREGPVSLFALRAHFAL